MILDTLLGQPLQVFYEGKPIGWLAEWTRRGDQLYADTQPPGLLPGMIIEIQADGQRITGMVVIDRNARTCVELQSAVSNATR